MTVDGHVDPDGMSLAAEAARNQLQWQSELLALSYDAIFAWEIDGGITFWNRGAEELYGYSQEDVLGKLTHQLLGTVAPISIDVLLGKLRSDGRWEGELLHTTRDGRQLTVEGRLILSRLNTGKTLVLESARDITERRAAERRLRRSEENLRLATAAAKMYSWELDLVAQKTSFGTNFTEVLGLKAPIAEMDVEQTFQELIHPADADKVRRYINDAIDNPAVHSTDVRLNNPETGETIWIETSSFTVRDKDNRPVRLVGVSQNITERKQAEDRIKQQAALINTARDAIFVTDLNQRVLFWNRGAERIYGYNTEEVIGRSLVDILYEGRIDEINAGVQILNETGIWISDTHHKTKSGKPVIIERRWTLVRNDLDQPDYILIINTDVTERKTAEEQLFRSQRMESIGTLAGGIAHDLNNILSPIMMAIDMLKIRNPDGDSIKWLDIMRQNAERGAELVKQVLTFARGMRGDRVQVQLKHILKDLISVLTQTMPKSVSIKFHIDPELWSISADPTQMHQVLMNIAINARDAMPGGGQLKIEATNIRIDENYARMNVDAEPGNYVMIILSDTGIGMTRELVKRIFDPFFTTKEIGEGTGLGLATSMTIINSHGGFLNVYSEPGRGSRFTIYLPSTYGGDLAPLGSESVPLPRGNGETLLIVDDEENIRSIAEATLSQFGYTTLTAADGTEALAVYSQHRDQISVVLTDLAMPYMDGTALVRALRKLDPTLRIIAMSGLMNETQWSELDSLDANACLSKPYSAETLLTTIKNVLNT